MKITGFSPEEIIDKCIRLAEGKKVESVVTLNSLMLRQSWHNPELKEALRQASFVICDSIGIQLIFLITRGRLFCRYPGVELMEELVKRGLKSFFIGGRKGVALKASGKLSEKYPGADICAVRDGYFKKHHEVEIIREINCKKPQVVFIGVGIPKQEIFINRIREKIDRGLLMGVGGSFDVLSGSISRAPAVFINTGMEWSWRLFLQPRRITRILELPVFVLETIWRTFKGKNFFE